MAQVSRFATLPLAVQERIEKRLAANGFSQYEEITAELRRSGFRISKSALHRHGQALKDRLRALRDTRLVEEAERS